MRNFVCKVAGMLGAVTAKNKVRFVSKNLLQTLVINSVANGLLLRRNSSKGSFFVDNDVEMRLDTFLCASSSARYIKKVLVL